MYFGRSRSKSGGSGGSSESGASSPPASSTSETTLTLRPVASSDEHLLQTPESNDHDLRKDHRSVIMSQLNCMSSIRLMVLLVLSLQNSLFTLLRRYSQGIMLEKYSKYECLLAGEVMKMVFSAWMIRNELRGPVKGKRDESTKTRLVYLVQTCQKMVGLALIYGAMNILSFVSLRNIGAGLFTIIAQLKIITTATFSAVILQRSYSWTKWRALSCLTLGVILFSHTIWDHSSEVFESSKPDANPLLGTVAVLIEVSLSGFASIYFEKVIKLDPLQLSIWERNFQLSLGSVPVYLCFIAADGGGMAGFGGGWSWLALVVATLGAAGGLLVALSIKYGDSILKTLATTSAIVLSSILDHIFLGGPLTPIMVLAGFQVIISICDYTFDQTIEPDPLPVSAPPKMPTTSHDLSRSMDEEEHIALIEQGKRGD